MTTGRAAVLADPVAGAVRSSAAAVPGLAGIVVLLVVVGLVWLALRKRW